MAEATTSIATIDRAPGLPDLVIVRAGAEMKTDMGRFTFCRWQTAEGVYWCPVKHVETLRRGLERLGHTVVDRRPPPRATAPRVCGLCHQAHQANEPHLAAPNPDRNRRGAALVRAAIRGETPVVPMQVELPMTVDAEEEFDRDW